MNRRAVPATDDTTLAELRALTVELHDVLHREAELRDHRQRLLEQALAAGHSKRDVAAAAGFHRTRLDQLLAARARTAG